MSLTAFVLLRAVIRKEKRNLLVRELLRLTGTRTHRPKDQGNNYGPLIPKVLVYNQLNK